ncbi:MAG: fasciclin domain-containing protein [Bacteroidota bacterium]
MRTQFNLKSVMFALALVLGLSACEPAGPTENIVEIATANADVSTLVSAIGAADLASTLEGDGPFTVFAPTNDAFADLPEELLAALLKPENKDALTKVLTYHVAAGQVMAADVTSAIEDANGNYSVSTVNGGAFTASLEDGNVVLTDAKGGKATVTATDVLASNGVIHLIDAVIVPADLDIEALLPKPDIVAVAAGNEDFSTLVTAVQAAGLVETLEGAGPFTVFAPTNAAFGKLPEGTVETLLKEENKATLTGILTYHVVAGNVDAATLLKAIEDNGGEYVINTVSGGKLSAKVMDGSVVLTDAAGGTSTVVATDVPASNGVIHVLDTVVLPN